MYLNSAYFIAKAHSSRTFHSRAQSSTRESSPCVFSYAKKTQDEKNRIVNLFENLNHECEIHDLTELEMIVTYIQKVVDSKKLTPKLKIEIMNALRSNNALKTPELQNIESLTNDLILAATHEPTFYSKYFPQFDNTRTINNILFKIRTMSCHYPNKGIYIGKWKDGFFHGPGKFTHTSGDQYFGEWKEGKFHGHGHYQFANGQEYDGFWENGKRNGMGTEKSLNGHEYQGNWKNNKRNGFGELTVNLGQYSVTNSCTWKDGCCVDKGILTFSNGKRYEGIWKPTANQDILIFVQTDGTNFPHELFLSDHKGGLTITFF